MCIGRQKEAIMATVDENLPKLEARLDLWRAKAKKAIASGNVSGQQAKINSQKLLDQLNSKLQEAQSKLDEAKAAGSEKWETLKGGVEKTWQELEDGFKKLVD
jgi:uncharacterized protein involved in exopolysaccharide biosynthesis